MKHLESIVMSVDVDACAGTPAVVVACNWILFIIHFK